MFIQLLSIETRKLLKQPLIWTIMGTLVFIFTAHFLVRYTMIATAVRNGLVDTRGLESDLRVGIYLFSTLHLLFYAATAAVISAYDYSNRSIQMWLTRGVSRPCLLLARIVLVLVSGFLLVLFVVLITLGMGMLTRLAFLGSFSSHNVNWPQLLPAILRMFAASIPYLMLTVLFAVISRSPIFAAAGTIIFHTVFEKLLERLANKYPFVIQYLPAHLEDVLQFNTYSIFRDASEMILGGAYTSEPQAILAVGILLIVLSALSLAIFSRQDLGS